MIIYGKNTQKFLSLSNKSDNEIWWRSKNENNKICYPFLIRITIQLQNKDKTKCAYCPWYKKKQLKNKKKII